MLENKIPPLVGLRTCLAPSSRLPGRPPTIPPLFPLSPPGPSSVMPRLVPAGAGRPPRRAGRSGFLCTRRPRARLRRQRRGRPRRLSSVLLPSSQPPSRLADLPPPTPSSVFRFPQRASGDGGGRDEREGPPAPSRLGGERRSRCCLPGEARLGLGREEGREARKEVPSRRLVLPGLVGPPFIGPTA